MRISTDQLGHMSRLQTAAFEDRVLLHLRKHHADQLARQSDEAIRKYIRLCIERAQRIYKLETEQAIVCYTQLPLILGPRFELDPRYSTIPALLGRQSFDQNVRAKTALSLAYHAKAGGR
jgi:hypothetical protein